MRAELVATTALRNTRPAGGTDVTDAEAVIAHAAMSSHDAETVLRRLIDDDRADFLAHASATLHVYGVSRAAAEIIRAHPGFAVSLRDDDGAVVPHLIAEDEDLVNLFDTAIEHIAFIRQELLDGLEHVLVDDPNLLSRRKRAAEAARLLQPLATATQLVITGSYGAWRGFVEKHSGKYEDKEIRMIARACLDVLQPEAPLVFEDLAAGERR